MTTTLNEGFLASVDAALADTDRLLAEAYPGEDGRRQPVHTVYVPADRYTPALPGEWGAAALALVADHGGMAAVCRGLGIEDDLAEVVADRVGRKLATDPIEDLRIDFEDGYGDRDDETEDAEAVRAATAAARAWIDGAAPSFLGIRFKCFEAPTRRRGIRTMDLFLGTLAEAHGSLPAGLVLTFPKVSAVSQVEAMVDVCAELERRHGWAPGALGFEVQVETPQLIVGADGRIPVAAAIHAGGGRVTALHYGTYDYSASLQISAAYQASDHPAADFAKQVMQVAVAGTNVSLSDGSTNVLPVGTSEEVWRAWRLHAGLVQRALERGFYQGWDLHAGQLPTRFAVNFAFYRRGFATASSRLASYLAKSATGILDEPATARALARYLGRGVACDAVDADEVTSATGLTIDQLDNLARPRSDTEGFPLG